jgi:putative SOS response-associated peptidase YedK
MCGRYSLTKLEELLRQFTFLRLLPGPVPVPPDMPRYNIAPTQPVLVIANNHPDRLEHFHWGLIPSWAKDPSIGPRLINARAETLAEKPAFRTALRRRRCLVPADGFFEWRVGPGKARTPMYFRLKTGEPFAFAGLWDVWQGPDGSLVQSCTLITSEPNELVKPIHNRMPVILPAVDYEKWLDPGEQEPGMFQGLLRPYPASEMLSYAVSRAVNSPRNDSPQCVEPAIPEMPGLFGDA